MKKNTPKVSPMRMMLMLSLGINVLLMLLLFVLEARVAKLESKHTNNTALKLSFGKK